MLWEKQTKIGTEFHLTIGQKKKKVGGIVLSRYDSSWLANSVLSGNHVTTECLIPVKRPPAAHLQQPRSPHHIYSCFWPCSADAPTHFLPLGCRHGCLHTSLHAASLAPGPSSPKTRTLIWSPACPVLGLQSNRPVGMAVLLSTCSWLLCVVSGPCVHLSPSSSVVLCWYFPIVTMRNYRGTVLNGQDYD